MSSVLDKNPQLYFAEILNAANKAMKNGQLDEAENFLQVASGINENDPDVINKLGIVKYKKGDYQSAKDCFLRVLNIFPFHFDANYNSAKVYQKLNDNDTALKYSEICLNIFPTKQKGLLLLNNIIDSSGSKSILDYKKNPVHLFNILFIQESPCIRNYKIATALKQRGHKVSLAYTKNKPSEMYKDLNDNVYDNLYKFKTNSELWQIISDFDIIHCHNEPDILTVTALASHKPVIHDTHDLISLRSPENDSIGYFESLANHGAHGRVYTTPYQLLKAQKLYNFQGPSIVLYNYISSQDLPDSNLEKLSLKDGNIHIVYEGRIESNLHQNFIDIFVQLASNKKIHIHIYPVFKNDEILKFFAEYPNIHFYDPVSPQDIIKEMTQYDVGIIPFNLNQGNKQFLETTIANKLFDYLAAGLPVVTSDLLSYRDFFKDHPVGSTFKNIDDLLFYFTSNESSFHKFDQKAFTFSYKDEIYRLEWLYSKVINEYYTKCKPIKTSITPKSNMPPIENNDNPVYELTPQPESDFKLEIPIDILKTRDLVNANIIINLSKVIINHYKWIKLNGFAGYDVNDIHSVLLEMEKKGQELSSEQQQYLKNIEKDPITCRNELGITKVIYPDSFSMFLQAFCLLPKDIENININSRIKYLYEIVCKHAIPINHGHGWTYPYDQYVEFNVPSNSIDAISTNYVGKGLLYLYNLTNDQTYLDDCYKVADYYENSLNFVECENDSICFNLTSFDETKTHKANLFSAEFLLLLGSSTNNKSWLTLGKKALKSSLDDIDENGVLNTFFTDYKIKDNNTTLLTHIEHLTALFNCSLSIENKELDSVFIKYFDTVMKEYFDRFEFLLDKKSNENKIDTFTIGMYLQLLSLMAKNGHDVDNYIYKIMPIIFDIFTNESGSFINDLEVQENKIVVNTFPYFIRYQASLLNGLVHILDYILGSK